MRSRKDDRGSFDVGATMLMREIWMEEQLWNDEDVGPGEATEEEGRVDPSIVLGKVER